jgi:hypothetical protein
VQLSHNEHRLTIAWPVGLLLDLPAENGGRENVTGKGLDNLGVTKLTTGSDEVTIDFTIVVLGPVRSTTSTCSTFTSVEVEGISIGDP